MAITKTHPIKSTLKLAIDYILNPEKTDGKILVSSFGCTPETADLEFEWTHKLSPQRGTHLARHLIQSFEPGETTPEQAHEIGKRLADEVLGGKFEYIISTHTDKGHVHNHIIFNAVSFVDYKKYHSNKQSYHNIRRISDKLCKEYGLSVIEQSKDKGKSYTEYNAAKNGTSWKSKLKQMIDKVIPQAKDFEDFIRLMEQNGYEVKRGKYISFRAEGQERFTRAKTLGENYTEEAITNLIANKTKSHKRDDKRISLIIDIQNNIKAQQSKGYEHWAKLHNLKEASKTINFLTEHDIKSYEELESKATTVRNNFDKATNKIKSVDDRLKELTILRKHISTYKALKPVYSEYVKARNKSKYENEHRSELTLFNASYKYLSSIQKDGKIPSLENVNTELSKLTEQQKKLYSEYTKARREMLELETIKQNVDMILDHKREHQQTRTNETDINI